MDATVYMSERESSTMKNLSISQANGYVYVDVDNNKLTIEIDRERLPQLEKPKRLDEDLVRDYLITYDNLVDMVKDLTSYTDKITTIKVVRKLFSPMGLREAKQVVDNILSAHGDDND